MIVLPCTGKRDVVLHDDAIQHMSAYRQMRLGDAEAGGQLFATFSSSAIDIRVATGPGAKDRRWRFRFWPNRREEQAEIKRMFGDGLHYVGDWHTHPEPLPIPSPDDIESIDECFSRSRHELDAFILVLVGTVEPPGGLWVGMHSAQGYRCVFPAP